MTVELRTLGSVIKETYEDNPNTNAYTDNEKDKLAGIEAEATKNGSDAQLLDRANHIGFQAATTITGLDTLLSNKVDVVAGKELTDNNFTSAEKAKLAGLEGPHFKGTYTSLAALQGAGIAAVAGDYADVDAGQGEETFRCIWDVTNSEWVQQLGTSTQLTGAQIKSEYEAQADTNAYTDSEKAKLGGIATEATKNSSDATLLNRSNHTGTQAISTVAGLQTALDNKINADGSKVLSDNNYTTAEKNKLAGVITGTGNNFTWRSRGTWNASTNNPNLANGTGTEGDYYTVSVAATRSFGAITYKFLVNDIILYSAGVWRKISVNTPYIVSRGTISPPIAALYATLSGNTNIASGSTVAISNWQPVYDQFSIMEDGHNMIIPSWASHARFSFYYTMPSASGDFRAISYIYRNGGIFLRQMSLTRNLEQSQGLLQTPIVPVSSGQRFDVGLTHNYGTAANLSIRDTYLQVELFEAN